MTSGQVQKDSTPGGQGKHGHNGAFDLHAAARRILVANGFEPDYDAQAKQQLDSLTKPASAPDGVRDMRDRPWSSIDNKESKDLDQIEIAEQMDDGSIRLVVGVADVDALVAKATPIDEHAYANCTSVYTGVDVFPMLPVKLSTGLTSLNEGIEDMGFEVGHDGRAACSRGVGFDQGQVDGVQVGVDEGAGFGGNGGGHGVAPS